MDHDSLAQHITCNRVCFREEHQFPSQLQIKMKAVQPVYQQAPVRSVSRARAFWRIAMTMAALASLSVAVQGALPDLSPVKVTEIHYHPANPSEVEAAINGAWQDGDFEFLELRNTSGSALDLSGAYFEGITFTFPAGTSIGAQGYLVLARNAAAFAARNPGISVAGVYQGNLANEGERITFRRSDAQRVFFVDYDDALPWPVWAASFGHSLININLTDNPNIPQNWRASPFKHGSPAAGDPGPAYGTEVIINEVLSRPSGPSRLLGSGRKGIGGPGGGNTATGVAACAGCHGPAGAGIPAQYPRVSGQFAEYVEAQLKAFRASTRANDPNGMMRGVAVRLNDREIQALAEYVAGLR